MSNHSAAAPETPQDQELVAYLDGELDAAEVARIEHRLSTDAEYRSRLQSLQRVWDMLDDLPRAQASDAFTETTVSMVVVKSTQEDLPRHRRFAWLLGSAGLASIALAATFGYLVAWNWWNAPNRQLLEDLPVIEKLDMYQNADSVEFLRRLAQEGLFDEQSRNEF